MIDLGSRRPGRAGVAGLTHLGTGNMRCTLAGCGHAIMTTHTGAIGLGVIYRNHRNPRASIVTGLADIRRVDVGR